MLFSLIFTAILQSGFASDGNLIVSQQNRVCILGNNATFRCQIVRNTTNGQEIVEDPHDIEWWFTPAGSDQSILILAQDQNSSVAVLSNRSTTGESGSTFIKYDKVVWPDITIHDVESFDAGTYTCKLVKHGISASAELYVIDTSPICTKNIIQPVYYEGDNVTLTCTMGFHGNQKPTINWQLPPANVDKKHTQFEEVNTENMVSKSVKLHLLHMVDGQLFRCVVQFGNITNPYTCETMFEPGSVQYAPYITHIKTIPFTDQYNHVAEEGSNLTLFCAAHGNPTPQYLWQFESPQGLVHRDLDCDGRLCRLIKLGHSDVGTYHCTVTNTVKGEERTAQMSVVVNIQAPGHTYGVSTLRTDGTTKFPVVTEYKDKGVSPYAIGAIVCASLAVILIIVFVFLALKMRRRERHLHQRLTRMHDENLDDQEVELLDESIQPDTSELPVEYGRVKQQWEIARKDIRLVDLIAKGSYVEVWRGRMRKYPRRNEIMKVAIKRIISEATDKERRYFLAELEVMKAIQPHPNILPLIGCYTGSDPWLIMVEYAVEGSLYQYLQHHRPGDLHVEINSDRRDSVSVRNQHLTALKLLSLTAQIVSALQHINRFKMIFYRLRASNVLVCKGGTCKLSGYGFGVDVTERNLFEANSLPLRWMSPESLLDNVFNTKTDVWSFGILLWEIVHFGHLPYPDMGPHEVSEKIQTGYRMPQPIHCSGDLYNLMLMCWAENPENRPSFGDIMQNLHHLAESADNHINIDKLPDGLRSSDIIDTMNSVA